ncbi:MAG: hypothetical protein SGJ07_06010 [Rhodospirillaceae bacterium]|nr:hypothetical protein [Rhodospirillaceae bacterium]
MNLKQSKSPILIALADDWPEDVALLVGQIGIAFAQLTREVYLATKRIEGATIEEWERENKSDQLGKWCCEIRKRFATETALISLIDRVDMVAKQRHDIFHAIWGRHRDGHLGRWRDGSDLGIDPGPMDQVLQEIRCLRDAINSRSRPEKG